MIIFRSGISVLIIMVLLIAGGCAPRVQEGVDMVRYEKALAETDPAKVPGLQPGSQLEKEAVRALCGFLPGIFLRGDPERAARAVCGRRLLPGRFREEVVGIEAIEDYFLDGGGGDTDLHVRHPGDSRPMGETTISAGSCT